jgi:predicted GTPase|mmetsp:Transcript_15718/g.33956  ORF Transcript_15718/g.33956 Transcript_15718/m.33956 type:complete len:275 (+) Transcript_15718:490-1314(+)
MHPTHPKEYELHVEEGNLLFAGVDYEMILREAEKDADIVLWDGGNNDFSFFKPDLTICVADALREGHEEHFYPGEINTRMADLIMINKVNSLPNADQAKKQAEHIRALVKPGVPILLGNSIVRPESRDPSTGKLLDDDEVATLVYGKRVLVIEDGPTCTHGGMPFGAGYVLAKQMGGEVVDPRPYAKGSLEGVFKKFQHLVDILPAMGYGAEQIQDLQETVQSVDCDVIIAGTPIALDNVITLDKPCVRARYSLQLERNYMDAMEVTLHTFVTE